MTGAIPPCIDDSTHEGTAQLIEDMVRQVRAISRWTVVTLVWLVVLAAGCATADAASTHGLGSSRIAEATTANARIGALFHQDGNGGHYCSASVVDSPGGDVIVTAAHCLASDTHDTVFVPAYRDGNAPYGIWKVADVVEDTRWTEDNDPDLDVAFAVLNPLHGKEVQQVVGANKLSIGATDDAPNGTLTATVTGYPQSMDEPITCSNTIGRFSGTQIRIDCTGYTDGTSGSPWVVAGSAGRNHDEGLLVGVIGGFEQGGYTADISYSSSFGTDVAALYRSAVTRVR